MKSSSTSQIHPLPTHFRKALGWPPITAPICPGAPIILGHGKTHVVTYADILRDLEPLNEGRDKTDRITYDSLRVHAKRHYDDAAVTAYWRARMHKELMNALGDNELWDRGRPSQPGDNAGSIARQTVCKWRSHRARNFFVHTDRVPTSFMRYLSPSRQEHGWWRSGVCGRRAHNRDGRHAARGNQFVLHDSSVPGRTCAPLIPPY